MCSNFSESGQLCHTSKMLSTMQANMTYDVLPTTRQLSYNYIRLFNKYWSVFRVLPGKPPDSVGDTHNARIS